MDFHTARFPQPSGGWLRTMTIPRGAAGSLRSHPPSAAPRRTRSRSCESRRRNERGGFSQPRPRERLSPTRRAPTLTCPSGSRFPPQNKPQSRRPVVSRGLEFNGERERTQTAARQGPHQRSRGEGGALRGYRKLANITTYTLQHRYSPSEAHPASKIYIKGYNPTLSTATHMGPLYTMRRVPLLYPIGLVPLF